MSQSITTRLEALERKRRGRTYTAEDRAETERIMREFGGGVYQAAWIREQYGIIDPKSEAVDRFFGGLEQLPKRPTTMAHHGEPPGYLPK